MKKTISILLTVIMMFMLVACENGNSIEATKTPFPKIDATDMNGNEISNDIFGDFDVTVVNFWSNGCGTCIEEMPELEKFYQELKDKNVNFIGVGVDSGENEENLNFAKKVSFEKGVTYMNISPNIESEFYKEFIPTITGFPTTFVVDKDGNIVGAAIIGNVKNQEETLENRINLILE